MRKNPPFGFWEDGAEKATSAVKKSSPINIFTGSKGSSAAKWVLGAGAVIIGGVLLWKLWPRGEDISQYLTFSVEPLQDTCAAGDSVRANVSVTNVGDKPVSPKIRFDIKRGTGGWTTVNENPNGFESFGDMDPDETVTKEMSMVLPENWVIGTDVYGRLVCLSHEGTVWTGIVARIPGPENIDMTVSPVSANVASGGQAQVNITFNNPNDSTVTVMLALDLKKSGGTWIPAPSEHDNWKTFNIPPGSSTTTLTSETIPTNWPSGTQIAARVMASVKLAEWGVEYIAWGDDNNYVFTVGGSQSQMYVTTVPGSATVEGLEHTCVDIGQKFKYSFQATNSNSSPVSVTYTVGIRAQYIGESYHEVNNTISLSPGLNDVTVYSMATVEAMGGHIMDFRVRIGNTRVYEGDQVAYVGPSQLMTYSDESFLIDMIPSDHKVSAAGQTVSFTLGFKHVGPAKNYKAGVYINDPYNTSTHQPYWIVQQFSCPEDATVQTRQVTVSGAYKPTTLGSGRVVDCMMAFMEASVTPLTPKVDSQLLFANWDAIVQIR